jgi:uracil-DNA glycosylase
MAAPNRAAAPPIPERLSFKALREAAQQCRACELWEGATQALVCLGATAAQALLGSHVRVGRDHGRQVDSDLAELVTLTTHPSAILRQRDETERAAAMDVFVADLARVARWLAEH